MCHLFNAVQNINRIVAGFFFPFRLGFVFFAHRAHMCTPCQFNSFQLADIVAVDANTYAFFSVSANGLIVFDADLTWECWPWPLNQKQKYHKLRQHF